jgi:hypothetical protein
VKPSRPNKYGAKKATLDGVTFDSQKEARHWQLLKLLEGAGAIAGLQRQVPYRLEVNGLRVCTYRADFVA